MKANALKRPSPYTYILFSLSPWLVKMSCNVENRVKYVICHRGASFERFPYKLCWLLNARFTLLYPTAFYPMCVVTLLSIHTLLTIYTIYFINELQPDNNLTGDSSYSDKTFYGMMFTMISRATMTRVRCVVCYFFVWRLLPYDSLFVHVQKRYKQTCNML